MPSGGKRPNSGPKKGTKYAPTLSKEAARELVRQRVMQDMEPMVAAQIAHAKGISHFMLRDPKTGKFERITDHAQIAAALNAEGAEEGSSYYIWAKDPSVQAFTDLMNRALDKPKEQPLEVDVNLTADIPARLARARQRAQLAKSPIEMAPVHQLETTTVQ